MPQSIEFNKQTTIPASTAGSNNLGVNSAGNVVLSNSLGAESVVGYINPLAYTTYVAKLTQQDQGTFASGYLTVGKSYLITGYVAGDDFSNVADVQSGTINTDGCVFIATGIAPANWTNGSQIEDINYPVSVVDENNFSFTPYWKRIQTGTYFFNFPYGIDYNQLTAKFSSTLTNNVLSTIAINASDYSFRDDTFYPNYYNTGFNSTVFTTAIQSDGKIVCGGAFSDFDGSTTPLISRLNTDGTLDGTFSIGTGFSNGNVNTIAIQSDGKIICGGSFEFYKENPIAACIARLDSSGNLDTTFNTNAGTGYRNVDDKPFNINTIAIQSDGKIVCGGDSLSNFNGTAVNGIFRLNTDGTLDTTFNVGGSGFLDKTRVKSIAIQADGKIICGGAFGEYGTQTYNGTSIANDIVRLNTDGTLDTTFNTNAGTGFNNKYVASTAIQSDGKILCGGDFIDFNGNTAIYIARLNADGTYDPTFNSGTGFGSTVYTILLDAADSAFMGGSFTSYNGTTSNYITRLDNSGSILNTFNNGFDSTVYTISQQADAKIVVGGDFNAYDGNTNLYITRLYGSYDVVLTSRNSSQEILSNQLLNNPVEIKLYS